MSDLVHRTITILFTDIVGSTRLWEEHPYEMESALARHDNLLRTSIEQYGGEVVKSTGDGYLAVFSDTWQGVSAALAAQRALTNEGWDGLIGRLAVRMGLNTGTAEQRAGDYYGTAVNRAARLANVAHGGQILISEPVYNLLRSALPDDVSFKDLGHHRLRDLSQMEHVFQLVAADLPAIFPALRTPNNETINLPVQLTPFIGRTKEIEALSILVTRPDVSLVTMTGPGGTGKTRLSIQAAETLAGHFPAGVTFVGLAPTKDPLLVPDAIAHELEVIEQPERSLIDSLSHYFAGKKALLILDNFEHLMAARPFVTELLAHAPQLKIVVTSRQILYLNGEHEYPVPPLHLPDPALSTSAGFLSSNESVALFVQRAQATAPNFTLKENNAPTVAAICMRLDGLPLAIELAAARVRLISPQQILDRLDNRLRFLTGGARDLPSRQRTLRGAIDWSYDLLREDERRLFTRLAVFTGGRSLEAVETVCGPGLDMDVLDGISSLLDKSLLVRGDGHAGESRYYMLGMIREYAAERLAIGGEAQQMQARHLAYFLNQAEEMEPCYRQHGQLLLLKRTAAELGNFRAAFNYAVENGRPGEAARLIAALDYYLRYRDRLVEGQRWFQKALQFQDQIPQQELARFLLGAGRLAWVNGAMEQCYKLFIDGLKAAQAANDRCVEAWLLVELSSSAFHIDGRELSLQRCEQGLAIFQELDDQPGIATAYNNLGEVARLSGNYDQARAMYETCLAACRETGEITRQIMQSHNLAYIAYRQRDFARARDLNISCLEQMVEIDWKHGSIDTLWNLAGPLTWLDQEEKAARLLGASAALLVEMGVVPHPSDIHELALYTADVRARLDENTFEALYAEGGAMTLQQAVDYALMA